ncbi:hypothetical protein [Frateuria aurantia]|uniref:hypothetical protein n=1 Tax=Frateuria aurantia TaxID=81475 RepID=UPI0002463267|nr:hypothetical protein [Frateuria aurantia]
MGDPQIKWERPGDDAFLYDTIGDAIDASGGDLSAGSVIRFGQFTPYQHLSASTLSWEVISSMADHAKEKHGFLADDYESGLLDPHHKSLVKHLRSWLSELPPAMFGAIKNIQEHTITDEDMA